MALVLEQTLYNAEIVRYHRIAALLCDPPGALLESYPNRAERDAGAAPRHRRKFEFPFSGNPASALSEAYAAIKALPGWSGAQDA